MSATRLMRLECLRGAAAFYVLLHHYVRHNLPEHTGLIGFFRFGQAAVLVFFLLSGFVIHYASLGQHPEQRFGAYLGRRFRRIFPVFGIALACTYLVTSALAGHWLDPRLAELLLNLLQLQDRPRAGNWAVPYLGNSPLWSLSYEWWFYMLYFPLESALATRPALKRAVVLGIALLGWGVDVLWPNPFAHIASYLVLWWFGVEVARQYLAQGRVTFRAQSFSMASILVLTVLWGYVALRAGSSSEATLYEHPGLTFRHFLTTLGLIGAGWLWYAMGLAGFDRLLGPFRAIAPFSYALYVLHLPLLWLARGIGGTGLLGLLWVTLVIVALCWLVEGPVQRRIERMLRWAAGTLGRHHPTVLAAAPSPQK